MKKLTSKQVATSLKALAGWKQHGDSISKTFNFANYYETLAFANATAWVSHREDHHPDLEVGYNKCKMTYSTHSAGGLTSKDFACAGKIEKLLKL